jgi:hypothetical protein
MKRTLLDITQKISRKVVMTILTPFDLTNDTYSIWEAKGFRFVSILREVESRTNQDRLSIKINTQFINGNDYIVESGKNGLLIKFIKSQFEYELDTIDYIEIKGDIEQYA